MEQVLPFTFALMILGTGIARIMKRHRKNRSPNTPKTT